MLNNDAIIAKQKILLSGKQLFDVELTNRCNKICSMCPRKALLRKPTDMTPETFSTLVKWLPEDCYVMFAGFGEPILNKNIYSYIKELKQKSRDIIMSIYTNGKLLSENNLVNLINAGLDLVQLSVVDKTELESIQSIINLSAKNKVLENLRINVLYSSEEDIKELNSIICRLYGDIKKQFYLKKIHSRAGDYYDYNYCGEIKTCGTFFMDTLIDSEGNIQICSNDINGKNKLGNIETMTFQELLDLKKTYSGNKEIAAICKKCSDEYRIKHFEEAQL